MQTDYDEFIADQKVTKAETLNQRLEAVRETQSDLAYDFNDATLHPEENKGTLFGKIVQRDSV